MDEEYIKNLEFIKENINEGTYFILPKDEWEKFAKNLSRAGAKLLREIEQERDDTRKLRISLLFFRGRKHLNKLNSAYDEIAKNFDLFFDASMRWLKSVIEKNEYTNYQTLMKKYIEELGKHCHQASDYLGNLISSKRNDYYHYQALFLAVSAVFVAVISVIISIIYKM